MVAGERAEVVDVEGGVLTRPPWRKEKVVMDEAGSVAWFSAKHRAGLDFLRATLETDRAMLGGGD